MESNNESLYQLIHRSLTPEGTLPNDFSLPKTDGEKIHFADGAMDGISVFHTALHPEAAPLLEEAVTAASAGDTERARSLVDSFCKDGRMLAAIDKIQEFIIDRRDQLNAPAIYRFGLQLAQTGTHREEVKFGLSLLELFQTGSNENVRNMVRDLACSDEFTLFCLFVMGTWDNANEEIFSAAKNARGWGRIHAVERLEPETEEIETWLAEHGWDNDVLPSYSALECAQKTRYLERLRGEMSQDQYRAAAGLMAGLLDEGPTVGISACEEPGAVLTAFLGQSSRLPLTADDYPVIAEIRDYAESHDLEEPKLAADALLGSPACREALARDMAQGNNLRLAKRLGLDYVPWTVKAMEDDFDKNFSLVDLLMPDGLLVDQMIALFEERLPLDALSTGSADEMGLGEAFRDHRALSYIVQHLRPYPGKGITLLRAALNSPVVSNRNMALSALEEWVKKEDRPLDDLYPELHAYLRELLDREVREDVRGRLELLL